MDIRFLTTFLEVAQTRHFGKAADNLYLTQSAVSARIKLLEEYFNTSLFIRNRNSIQLSPAGEKLIPFARTLAATLSEARKALSEADFKHLGCCATPNAFSVFLDGFLSDFETTFSDISLRSDLAGNEQLSRQLHERSIEIAFTTEQLKSDDIESVQLCSVPLVLSGSAPQINDLNFERYVQIDWNSKITDGLYSQYPQSKNARFKSSNYQVALTFLHQQGGFALLPQTKIPSNWHVVATPTELSLSLYINYISGANHAALKDIIEFVTSYFVPQTGGTK